MTTVDRVAQAIRRNPEGLLLLGAGVALMLRNAAAASSKSSSSYNNQNVHAVTDRYYDSAGNGASGSGEGLASKVSAAADDVRSYVSDTAQDLSDKASEYGEAASRKTREAADSAYRSTRDAAGSAYRSVESAIEAHPVSIAIAGLAAGALAAALFPSTRFERDTLGPIGRRAAEAASETGELVKTAAVARVTNAALKAGEQLKDAVADGKFNSGTIGDVARDAASNLTHATGENAAKSTDGNKSDSGNKTAGSRPTDSRMAKAQL